MRDSLAFTLLGPLTARRADRLLPVGTPQQRALLAVLLLRPGQVIAVDEIITSIWGDAPPPGAGGIVRTYASRLRRVLGDGAEITHAAGGYAIEVPPARIDLTVYRDRVSRARESWRTGRAAEALRLFRSARDLWTGVPLEDVPGPYAAGRRAVLLDLRLAADLDCLELDLERRPHRGATLTELAGLVSRHPLHERPRELLVRSLARAGRRAEAFATYEEGRALLADRLGVDPGPGLVSARAQITTRLVPAQLPRDLADFTGRDAILRAVAEGVRDGAAGLFGPEGRGKTAIAVHAAHRLRDAYPDGQLYADLGESGVGEVLARFLRTTGLDDGDLPDGIGERTRLWRERLVGRRQLVLLDGVTGEDQIRALLPLVAGCTAVVTARDRLPVAAVRWIDVPPLTLDEGVELLGRIAGANRIGSEPVAAQRLVRATDAEPSRLRPVAERLASRPDWTVVMMLARYEASR